MPPVICDTARMQALPPILILAAGAARRMRGGDKLLEVVDGQAQLRRITLAAVATGAAVTVALPPDRPLREAALTGLPVEILNVSEADQGLSATLRAGHAAIAPGPILLVLADLPDLTATDLRQVMQAHAADPALILRGASVEGTPGHPVLLPGWLRPDLDHLTGDAGAGPMLQRHASMVRLIALPGAHATTDLDTPEEWEAWRALRGK